MMYGWILGILLLLIVIWFFTRRNFQETGRSRDRDSPLGLLKRRYARGEMSREEFEKKKKDLNPD